MKRGGPLKRFTPLKNSPFRPAAQPPGAERTEGARDPALPRHGRSRMRPVSEKRAKEGAARTRAVRRLRALGDRCARCNSPYRLHGHERTGRAQGGDATQPDCLLCTVCNEWCESEPILAAWTGWKLSKKHPRNPSLAPDQAIRTDGSIYTFPALEAA